MKKFRVFKVGRRLNTLAWNNGIGLGSYFVGFWDRSNDQKGQSGGIRILLSEVKFLDL